VPQLPWPVYAMLVVTSVSEVKVSDNDNEDGSRLEKRNFANVV
jgi:hypothetical protein